MINRSSIILALYLFLANLYYPFAELRPIIFGFEFVLSLYMGLMVSHNSACLMVPKKLYLASLVIFFFSLIVQLINGTFTPFVIYYLTAPLVAYFVYSKQFNTNIIITPLFLFYMYLFVYVLMHKNLTGSMGRAVSENYISVIIIFNLVVFYLLRFRQKEKIIYIPALLGLILSVFAFGRAGIIVCFFILLLTLYARWTGFTRMQRITLVLAMLIPLIYFVVANFAWINNVLNGADFFHKFTKSGVASPSRDIIKREYFEHIDLASFFIGYNYVDNYWFQHYGLNPHNSYIRLHYFSGLMFFVIIPIVLFTLFKLIRKSLFVAGLLVATLLRSYTDSVMFLTLFDFIIFLFILIAFYEKSPLNRIKG